MNGGDVIGKTLAANDVKMIFTVCGGHISPILVGAKKHGIKVIDTRTEATAVFAADARARLTGKPSVAVVTAGPGVTNTITAIKNAQMAMSPVVLLGGAVATILRGRGALQDIEQLKLFDTITKQSRHVDEECDVATALEEALAVAASGVPGPVFVEYPIDILYDENIVRDWYGVSKAAPEPKSIKAKVTKWYLKHHVDKLFACSPDAIEPSERGLYKPFSMQHVNMHKVTFLLNRSEKPVLVVGSQAMFDPDRVTSIIKSIEQLGIPTFLTGMARGLLGKENPLHIRHDRSKILKEADLIILAGMPVDFRLNYGREFNKKAKIIAINRNKDELALNISPDLAFEADPGRFIEAVEEEARFNGERRDKWFSQLAGYQDARAKEIETSRQEKSTFINPLYLCDKIDELLDDDSIIIGDGGDFIATAANIVSPRQPFSWLDPGPFGTLGAGAGFALAAKLTRPQADVWLLYGDGAAGYSLVDVDTLVRHHAYCIIVIGNDAAWSQITRDQVHFLNDDVGTILAPNDYHITAEGFGAKGLFVDDPSKTSQTLTTARELVRKGHVVVINARLGPSGFREGSISV